MNHTSDNAPVLFTVLGTPVSAEAKALLEPALMGTLGAWALEGMLPPASWADRARRWLLGALLAEVASFAHCIGHMLTARAAGAPMERLHLTLPFPQTLYDDTGVSPLQHAQRSVGGPIANALLLVLGALLVRGTARGSLAWEALSLLNGINAFLGLGSLAPLPMIDGGTMLKWGLVDRGQSERAADRTVRRANGGSALLLLAVAAAFAWRKQPKIALLALLGALVGAGVARERVG